MQTNLPRVYLIMLQQASGMARILTGHNIRITKRFLCSMCEIAQIPNRRWHENESAPISIHLFSRYNYQPSPSRLTRLSASLSATWGSAWRSDN